jgi:hypothetical protein
MNFIVRVVVRVNPATASTETYEHGPFVTRGTAESFATAFVSSHCDVVIVDILDNGLNITRTRIQNPRLG